MWISCQKLREAGITTVKCCGSCHDDADDGWDWEMCGIYENDVLEGGDWLKLIGGVCCAVSNALEKSDPRVLELYRREDL